MAAAAKKLTFQKAAKLANAICHHRNMNQSEGCQVTLVVARMPPKHDPYSESFQVSHHHHHRYSRHRCHRRKAGPRAERLSFVHFMYREGRLGSLQPEDILLLRQEDRIMWVQVQILKTNYCRFLIQLLGCSDFINCLHILEVKKFI